MHYLFDVINKYNCLHESLKIILSLFIYRNKNWRFLAKAIVSTVPTEQKENVVTNRSTTQDETTKWTIRSYFNDFHRRYITTAETRAKSCDLLMFRAISIAIWLFSTIIEFLVYSNTIQSPNVMFNFLFSSSYSLKDISSIIYASGAAAYGASIEIYILLPLVCLNGIFAVINCGIHQSKTIDSIMYIVKTVMLLSATELSFQNFKRFTCQQSYKLYYQNATRAILRQSLYLSVTIIFLVSPGLRTVYNGVKFKCHYKYWNANESYCNIIDIDQPLFADNNDSCVNDYIALVTGVEQLRIIRDIALCSIAFYSMHNRAFFDISGTKSIIHNTLVILFVAMSCSFIVANIDPFLFQNIKLYFAIIELILFIGTILLLILNLWKKNEWKKHMIMEEKPIIIG